MFKEKEIYAMCIDDRARVNPHAWLANVVV